MPFEFKDEKGLVDFVINSKLPDWQSSLFKRYAEAVQVHSRGEIFCKVDSLFPNEQEDSKKHRILAFESVTEASFGRAANNVNRIFKSSSFTVEASDKTIEASKEHKEGHNLYNWFLDEWINWAMKEDPNSRIVVYPDEYVKEGNPRLAFVGSEYIKRLPTRDEECFVFVSECESEVAYELEELKVDRELFYDQSIHGPNIIHKAAKNTFTPKIKGVVKRFVYHAFFKGDGFYRIEQLKKGQGYSVEHYPIKQDFLPVTDAGGEVDKKKVNKSFLHPFVPFGNLALLQHSQHTAVNFTFSFPRMSEIQTPCDDVLCKGTGIIQCLSESDIEKYGDHKSCLKCGGSGYTRNQTPYKVYVKNFDPQGMEGDQKYLEVPDVQYYTPDVSILDYSKNEWKTYLEMAETAVYIQQRVQTGNVEAAKSKEIDREDLYAFLYKVGQTYFSKLRFVLQCLENYAVPNPMAVVVNVPFSYAILSEGEAFTALKDILGSNVPVMIKANQTESFINKFVSQSSPIRKFLDVLKLVDPLLYYSSQEISTFKANNVVSEEQFANHVFAYPTLQVMYSQDKNLFIEEPEMIAEKLKTELQQYKPKPVEDLKTKLLKQQNEA